jgi:hypothetical protein
LQEAAAGSSVADDGSTELTAHERELVMKSMGTMDEGDAILGSGAEVNLESQVSTVNKQKKKPNIFTCIFLLNLIRDTKNFPCEGEVTSGVH